MIPESYRTSQNKNALVDYELPNRTTFYAQLEDEDGKANPNKVGAEKVSVLQTKLARHHTTYYDKKNNLWREPVNLAQENIQVEADISNPNKVGAEKVSVLQTKLARHHTTYYDKKNKLWRGETTLVQSPEWDQVMEDLDAMPRPIQVDTQQDEIFGVSHAQDEQIGDKGIDPNVHAFANPHVDLWSLEYSDKPYLSNGSALPAAW